MAQSQDGAAPLVEAAVKERVKALTDRFPIYQVEGMRLDALPLLRQSRHPGEGLRVRPRTTPRSGGGASAGSCGGRFTTFERVQLRELTVIKRNGRRVPFDRDKLMRSVQVALRKRPVDPERVERMVNGIVRQLESSGEAEIPSEKIGQLVMEGSARLDDVAYVRFASVYRNFREAKDFENLLGELSGEDDARVVTIRK